MSDSGVVVFTDKTVLKVTGLSVKGLDTRELESILTERIGSVVRVIGVTGSSIDMDVYGIDPEMILRDEAGIIKAISTSEGITPSEVTKLASAQRVVEVDFDSIEKPQRDYCAGERWRR